jgi:hypothetical protein
MGTYEPIRPGNFTLTRAFQKYEFAATEHPVIRAAGHQGTIITIMKRINELFEQYRDVGLPLIEISPSVGQIAVIRRYSQE